MDYKLEIKSSNRSKKIRLVVKNDGHVIVTKPFYVPTIVAERYARNHSDWISNKIEHFKKHPARLLGHLSIKDYKANKERARALVHQKIEKFNRYYGHNVGNVRIGNQKSRWGSCSKSGNLNFNYKLIFLPIELQDYIIVHELCHLVHLNHSRAFWSLVEEQIPDWRKIRNDLKLY